MLFRAQMKNTGEIDNFSRKYYIIKITVIKSIIPEQTTVHEGDQKLLTVACKNDWAWRVS